MPELVEQLAAGQVVATHVGHGPWAEQADAVELAAVEEHVAEAQVVIGGRHEPAASGEERRGPGHRPSLGHRRELAVCAAGVERAAAPDPALRRAERCLLPAERETGGASGG